MGSAAPCPLSTRGVACPLVSGALSTKGSKTSRREEGGEGRTGQAEGEARSGGTAGAEEANSSMTGDVLTEAVRGPCIRSGPGQEEPFDFLPADGCAEGAEPITIAWS